jgi:hypothetical protein
MKIQRREFLKTRATFAIATGLQTWLADVVSSSTAYPYLGRNGDN